MPTSTRADIKPGRSYCSAVESYDCIAPAGFRTANGVASNRGVAKSELHECAYCSEPVCGPCSTEITGDTATDPLAGKRVCLTHTETEIAVWLGVEEPIMSDLDLDTVQKGTKAPFEPWEGDHTAVVHVLRHAEHNGWLTRRPGADRPLRRAIFDRLFHRAGLPGGPSYTTVVDDLRAILDEFDRARGGIDGANLDRDAVPAHQRDEGDGIDLAVSALGRSRALAARQAYDRAATLRNAAHYFRDLSAETIDRREVIAILERLAAAQVGKVSATEAPS